MNIEIYSKPGCVYCDMAKRELLLKNIPFTEKILGLDFNRETIVERYSMAKTFPVIVVDNFYLGGYNELKALLERREQNGTLLMENN